jgi:hypothetical protein
MNERVVRLVVLVGVLVCIIVSKAPGGASEETLLQAWQKMQQDDPKTVVFEKLRDRQYRFKTERFPYDGEVRVLNLVIDDRDVDSLAPITGHVELELADLPEDFYRKHARSYSIWSENNTLYFDQDADRWATSREYWDRHADSLASDLRRDLLCRRTIMAYAPFIIMIVIVVGVFWLLSRSSKARLKKLDKRSEEYQRIAFEMTERSLQLSARSVELSEENNRVLKEILEVLKSRTD